VVVSLVVLLVALVHCQRISSIESVGVDVAACVQAAISNVNMRYANIVTKRDILLIRILHGSNAAYHSSGLYKLKTLCHLEGWRRAGIIRLAWIHPFRVIYW
jgi:hypothetical protein